MKAKAVELYRSNLLPNRVYSELPAVRDSIVQRFLEGSLSAEGAGEELSKEVQRSERFIILSGIKTTDGETGSVGPQVAEGVSELLGTVVPHATYVEDFDIAEDGSTLTAERMIGRLSQRLEMSLPALLTVSTEFRPHRTLAAAQPDVRLNNYRGKASGATKWTADDLGADPKRLGLAGSPTIVGTGIEVGKPPVQKSVGKSLVFAADVQPVEFEGKKYGPYAKGDLAAGLPGELVERLKSSELVELFGYEQLAREVLA